MEEIDHVAHAVWDVSDALDKINAVDGFENVWTLESDKWQYETAYNVMGTTMFTLIAPTSDESFIADYLEQNGEGLHHIGVNVSDLDAAVEQLTGAGGEVIMEDTVPGVRTEATFHPKTLFGLQLQLIEWHDDVGPTARDHIEAMREAAADDRV
ncbi:VOC family protein [Natrinema caseinilyticum]|uniref:VOC family protein n=1 Tax=Natrinema caseinilyticum TaxID=2961570 RepID=UPI0020C4CF21|nr:VOC family protein [Natrinema caseinilyticum]